MLDFTFLQKQLILMEFFLKRFCAPRKKGSDVHVVDIAAYAGCHGDQVHAVSARFERAYHWKFGDVSECGSNDVTALKFDELLPTLPATKDRVVGAAGRSYGVLSLHARVFPMELEVRGVTVHTCLDQGLSDGFRNVVDQVTSGLRSRSASAVKWLM
ncbi:hypothetical protein Tco_1347135 [Tanacetum coccineum]